MKYFFSDWPAWVKWPLTHTFWPEERPITTEELKYGWTDPDGTTHQGLNQAVTFPGVANAWAVPDREPDQHALDRHQDAGGHQDHGLRPRDAVATGGADGHGRLHDRRHARAYPERTFGGYYLDFDVKREAARYGLNVGDVQDVIQSAVGGMNVTTTVEGLERYPLNVRYARELRDDIPSLRRCWLPRPPAPRFPLASLPTSTLPRAPR